MKRSAVDAMREFVIGPARLFQRQFFSDRDESVEARLLFVNPAERLPREFKRRHLARTKFARRFVDCHGRKTTAGASSGESSRASRRSSSRRAAVTGETGVSGIRNYYKRCGLRPCFIE